MTSVATSTVLLVILVCFSDSNQEAKCSARKKPLHPQYSRSLFLTLLKSERHRKNTQNESSITAQSSR